MTKIKRDINDTLFSQLVRMNHTVCQMCLKDNELQCCHIFGRRHYSTRFDEENAVVLCMHCHKWFDTHKINACLFDKKKRVFNWREESYHFLVERLGYTWKQLEALYHRSQEVYRGYKGKKKEITKTLREKIAEKEGEF